MKRNLPGQIRFEFNDEQQQLYDEFQTELMKHIRAIGRDLLLILETTWQLRRENREISPLFALRQNEKACWFLENCERLQSEFDAFKLPGN